MEVRTGKMDDDATFFYPCECKNNCPCTIKAGEVYKVVEIFGDIYIISNECYDKFVADINASLKR